MNKPKNDLTGKRFGRLFVLSPNGKDKWGHWLYLCQCNCGTQKIIMGQSLISGNTRSCGCYDWEKHIFNPNRKDHGQSHTRLYRIWKAIKARCYNPNTESYQKWYGAKGVKMCDEWYYNFWIFRNWAILHGYKDNLSIDRIDPYGDYEPSNCRWATAEQQANNKRGGADHA